MSMSLYGWVLHCFQSDGKCEGCDLTSCARFSEALFCPYTGAEMKAMKRMRWTFTNSKPMEREGQ